MQVSFTGIKNVGYRDHTFYDIKKQEGNTIYYNKDEYIHLDSINFELTDDFSKNENDLTEYNTKIMSSDVEVKKHPFLENFLNFTIVKGHMPQDNGTYFLVNGSLLEVNDDNLPMVSFVTKILNRIANSKELPDIETRHIFHKNLNRSILPGFDLKDFDADTNEYFKDLANIHDDKNVKKGAKNMLDLINQKMMEYFEV